MRLLETPRSGNCKQVKVICNKTLIVVYKSAETHKSLGRLPQSKLVRFQHTILAGLVQRLACKSKKRFLTENCTAILQAIFTHNEETGVRLPHPPQNLLLSY